MTSAVPTTVNPSVILKYIFKNNSKVKKDIDIYTLYLNLFKLFLNYKKNIDFLNYINSLVKDFPNISKINLLDINKNLAESVYMIYTNLFRYIFNKQTDILTHFKSTDLNQNKLGLSDNIYIYKWIYIYGNLSIKSKQYNFLEFRNKFLTGTLVYFNILINQFTYLKNILSDNEFNDLSSIENINVLEETMIQKIFDYNCNYIDSNIDNNLLSIFLGIPVKTALQIDNFSSFTSHEEFIKYKLELQEKILNQNKTVFSNTITNNFIKSINTDCKYLGTILTKYINTFIYQHSYNIRDIYIILYKYNDMSDERYSVKLKKFKEYYLENSFINL